MYAFNYHRAKDIAEATALMKSLDDATFIAGGMTLVPTLKQRLAMHSDLIDLGDVSEMKGISVSATEVSVGALTSHAAVNESAEIQQAIPALAETAGKIGDPMVRNRGTLGGSIANSDPAADYPAAVLGLGATIHTDRRSIAADDFFIDLFETALEEDEIITRITFPVPKKSAYMKFDQPASRFALVGAFVAVTDDGVRVAITGAGPCVYRFTEMEAALDTSFTEEATAGIPVPLDDLNSDIHADPEYRAQLVSVMVRRAVASAR